MPPSPSTHLRRMKRLALAALLLALGGLGLSLAQGGQGGWAWLRAFCEAAAVGALADWFAVVALFRRPLGLPIPHTALVPQNQGRIAEQLAAFVGRNFLTPQALLHKLQALDPAAWLARWLSQPETVDRLTGAAGALAREGVALLDEAALRPAVRRFVLQRVQAWDAAATGASVLQWLSQDGRQQALLDSALAHLRTLLDTPEARQRVATRLTDYAAKEWPTVIALVNTVYSVDKMAGSLGDALARQLVDELKTALDQPDHPLRQRLDAWVQAQIQRLATDPELAERVRQAKQRLTEREDVQQAVDALCQQVAQAVADDLADADRSALLRHLRHGLAALGQRLGEDPTLAAAVNTHVLALAERSAAQLHDEVTRHIASTVRHWNATELVDQLELGVGRDLQFIRLNGTLVGGLIGLLLHAVVSWVQQA